MPFSSLGFLFLFLPLVLAAHASVPPRARNAVLLVASLVFYATGEDWYVLVMLVSIVANYGFGLAIAAAPAGQARSLVLGGAIAANLVRYGTFKALFPQLIAGPIVRYREIADALATRRLALVDFAAGAERFVIGLAKKVLIANVVAMPADAAFQAAPGDLSAAMAWFGVACYALQIYFDFSGYSDMAIGLGRMLGFRFPENFDHPYAARSVREFWRRWHMTLSRWFRDYVYLPLGGSRGGRARTALNLVAVFVLCGLWHGASWTFVLWGLWHGAFIALEHAGVGRRLDVAPRWVGHVYLVLVVVTGWVWFRAPGVDAAVAYGAAMLGLSGGAAAVPWSALVNPEVATAALVGALGAFGLGARLRVAIEWWAAGDVWRMRGWLATKLVALSGLMVLGMVAVTAATINPFIYFRF
jgi:alginate O-acetyltransferase complex protein AlgI